MFQVLSVLTDWCSSGKAQLSDFESDPRFIRLCKVLTKPLYTNKYSKVTYQSRSEDLSTVLDVKADDEAAKLIGSITLPQMVKVSYCFDQSLDFDEFFSGLIHTFYEKTKVHLTTSSIGL